MFHENIMWKLPFIGSSTRIWADHVLFSSLDILSLKALEAALGDGDVGDEGVELVHGVLVLIP